MESKYKDAALKLYNKAAMKSNTFANQGFNSLEILELMCELAEETEKETVDQFLGNPGYTWYTKEQLKEAFEAGRKSEPRGMLMPNKWVHETFKDYLKSLENDTGN